MEGSENTVIGREKEYAELRTRIRDFEEDGLGGILYITGVPGSGKTHTITTLLTHMNIKYIYVNVSALKRKNRLYGTIVSELCNICTISPISKSAAGLRTHMHKCKNTHIIIIDEVDFLYGRSSESVIYNLFEIPFIENSRVLLIAISNTLGSLSSKIESRIGKNRINFIPYRPEQLLSIIKEENLYNKKFGKNPKSLDFVTKKVASSVGDIRLVRKILAKSKTGEILDIHNTIKKIQTPFLSRFTSGLNYHQKIVLYTNKDSKKNILEWYNEFLKYCNQKGIEKCSYIDFKETAEDLEEFGFFQIQELSVRKNYLYEELDTVISNEKDFQDIKNLL